MNFKKFGFFHGVALTICLSSLVGVAATNLPGFFVFTAGTPISSSEINSNFEKIAGNIVVHAKLTTPFTGTNAQFEVPSDCPTCTVFRKRINFNSIITGNLQTAVDADPSAFSEGSNFHYYQIPSDGWYEIKFLASTSSTYANEMCLSMGCMVSVNSNVNVTIADNLTIATTTNLAAYLSGQGSSKDIRDNNNDAVFDPVTSYPSYLPEARKFYLKSGQILFVRFESNYSLSSATADFTVGASSMELIVTKF